MATHQTATDSIESRFSAPSRSRRSQASSMVWLAIASDVETLWRDGKMVSADGLRADDPFCPVYGEAFASEKPSSVIQDWLSALDRQLPSFDRIENALSARDFVAPLDPAVGRIPEFQDVSDAGICIFATRILLGCRHRLIPPAFVSASTAISSLEDASFLAASVGGVAAIREAIRIASRPGVYQVREDDDEGVEFGEACQ